MATLFLILGGFALAIGFVGCLLPVIPGPPIAWLALLFVELASGGEWVYAWWLHAAILAMVVVVTILDLVVPAWGAKRYGASRTAIVLSVVGLLVGLVVFPPFGFLIGAWLGALIGELLEGKSLRPALAASWGVLVGTVAGIALKLGACVAITYFYVIEVLL